MFYDKLNINGVEYQLHTTLTGEGPPPESLEAEVGMRYMDTESEAYYKRTTTRWVREIAYNPKDADGVRLDSIGASYADFQSHVIEVSERFYTIDETIGGIETALDNIIAMQNSLIGGESV